jgi:hypothetical protein
LRALNLSKAELRWSYTVFLQSLIRFLEMLEDGDRSRALAAYIRACLLHYARWMAKRESFYLDRPEQLEYPTETWAAQELRKANVLTAAAHLVEREEAELFRARAEWFYERAWTTLLGFATWHYTRPLVLAIQMGLYAASFADSGCLPEGRGAAAALEAEKCRSRFVPQREAVRRGARSPVRLLGMLARSSRVWRWREHWKATWAAQRVRHLWRGILD